MFTLKTVILLVCFSLSVPVCAQSKDSLLIKNTMVKNSFSNFKPINYNFDFKNLRFLKNESTLSLYNKTTNLYDNYLGEGDAYIYSNSSVLFENKSNFLTNLFLGNNSFIESNSLMQNNYFMLDDNSSYRVRDSFNPYGASNISQALVGGVLGLLFN